MRVLLIVLFACAKRPAAPSYEAYAPMDESAAYAEAERGGRWRSDDAPAPPPPPPPAEPATSTTPSTEPAPAPATQPAPAERMVHYDGWAQVRVADPPATLDAVSKLAEEAGGRTERLAGNTVSVRVPVQRFEAVWAAVLDLGDVMNQSVRADDVTEQYLAIDLRARTLKATRDRLIELLAKAQDEEEKLALLQEITRVTEELDAIEAQLRTLSDLASMSRISVEAVPREAFTGSGAAPELAGFEWIRALSPFNRGAYADTKRIALPVPEGLVALAPRGPFAAESADGVVLWTLRVPNDPVGTADFWMDTVEDRLAEEFSGPRRKELGGWDCLAVDEPGADEPYTWQVCVREAGRWLHLAQAYFPGPAEVTRYAEVVDAALRAGGES